ncbi:MAG: LysE family translocator [Pseudomonadota bacterium]
MPIHHVWAFLAAAAFVILVPGPATLLVAGEAQQGRRGAALTTLGIVLGDLVLIGLSAAGVAALVTRWSGVVDALAAAGALYVIHLGARMWRPQAGAAPEHRPAGRHAVARGLLLTLTNPKPILFFGAFFPLFIDPRAQRWLEGFALLGLLFEALNIAYFTALTFSIERLSRVRSSGRVQAFVRRAGALALVGCGAWALTRLDFLQR